MLLSFPVNEDDLTVFAVDVPGCDTDPVFQVRLTFSAEMYLRKPAFIHMLRTHVMRWIRYGTVCDFDREKPGHCSSALSKTLAGTNAER
jgi:hypothetical protein